MKTIFTIMFALTVSATFAQSKPDTTHYKLTETQVIQISQLLNFGEVAAGNSDKITTAQYNQYHAQVAKIDSVLGAMYRKWHPVKAKASNTKNR